MERIKKQEIVRISNGSVYLLIEESISFDVFKRFVLAKILKTPPILFQDIPGYADRTDEFISECLEMYCRAYFVESVGTREYVTGDTLEHKIQLEIADLVYNGKIQTSFLCDEAEAQVEIAILSQDPCLVESVLRRFRVFVYPLFLVERESDRLTEEEYQCFLQEHDAVA